MQRLIYVICFQLVFPDCGTQYLGSKDAGDLKLDKPLSDLNVSDTLASQPSKPTARSVETLTNQIVCNIIGEVTRRNSAELMDGVSSAQSSSLGTSVLNNPAAVK